MAPVCLLPDAGEKACLEAGCGGDPPPSAPKAQRCVLFAQVKVVWSTRKEEQSLCSTPRFAGEYTARGTPVPIPNTEVKPRWADGTARVSVWERR